MKKADIPAYVIDYLNYIEVIKGKSNNTVNEYYLDLRTFFRFIRLKNSNYDSEIEFNKINCSDVTLEELNKIELSDLYEFMSYMSRTKRNGASARARKVSCLKSFFKYIYNNKKLIAHNPAELLELPKTRKSLPKYLTLDESINLLNNIGGEFQARDYCIITMFLNCGLRLSELVNINISDIKNDTLYVVGKGNKERTIYLNTACINAINDYLKVRPHDGVKDRNALFLSKRNQRISNKTVQYMVKKYMILSGLDPKKYSVHKLRHTAATLMYQHGNVDVRLLKDILGHENLSTTEIYTHINDNQLKDAANKNPLADIKKKKTN